MHRTNMNVHNVKYVSPISWLIAMGMKEFFALFVLMLGYLYLRPEGSVWNLTERGWVVSVQTLSAFLANLSK